MHPEIASALAEQHQHDLIRQAHQRHAVRVARASRRHAPSWRVPRYRVHWSRTTLSAAGAAGRGERSWVIVISATRGL